jgi:hypothetical protein
MSGETTRAHSGLTEKLDEFTRKYYKNQIIRGALYSLAILVSAYLVVALLEYFGKFSIPVRTTLFWIYLTGTAFVLGKYIAIPIMRLFRMGRVISHEHAAVMIGNHFPEVRDKLLNTLQLSGKAALSGEDNSLLIASIEQRILSLRPVPFASAVDFRENRKYLRFALPPLVIVLIILWTDSSVLTVPTERLIRYSQHIAEEAPFRISLIGGSLEVVEGQNATLHFEVSGNEIPQSVYVEYQDQQFIMNGEDARHHSYTFRNVRASIPFRLYASGFYAGEYELRVLPAARVTDFTVELSYPLYLGRNAETVRNAGDLTVPEGTRITWQFSTRNTESVRLKILDSLIAVQGSGDFFTARHMARQSGMYSVQPVNRSAASPDSLSYRLQVIADQVPFIAVDEVRDSSTLGLVYFTGEVRDDYGFRRLVFHFTREDALSADGELISTELPVSREFNSDVFFHTWNIRDFGLEPGARYNYYFEIWDNDGVNGSKSARTQVRQFVVPTEEELNQAVDQQSADIKDQLEESVRDARKLQKELDELKRQMMEKQEMGWQDKKRLEELMKMQEELRKQVEEIQQKNEQKNQLQNEFTPQNESILEKQRMLEELMEQIMSPELREMMDELQRLMNELDKDKLEEQLDKMSLNNEDIEKELDRALEQFKQLEWEQKMEDAVEKLKDLAEKQEQLAEKSEDKQSDAQELKKEQEQLNKEFEELRKELDQIEKLNDELENPNSMPETESQEEGIEQDQQKSADELEKNKKSSAGKSQKSAGQKMKEMAGQMEMAMEASEQEQQQEDMEALRALLENIIRLSFDQEDVMGEFRVVDIKDPKYNTLGQRQRKLKDDARMVEDSLFALSKRVPQISAAVNREINLINDHMEQSISAMPDRRTAEITTSQQYVMTSFNNLALMLDEALKQMQQQSASSKPGQGNCEKPGGNGKKPSAGEMKKMQEALSKQLEQLKKEGKNKGENKGQNGQMSRQLAEMAAKQAAIRKMMEEKASELNEDGSGNGNELKQIAKDMEQLQKDIVNNQITEESLRRQQDILIRLLKAENAERVRDQDNERKSNEAKDSPLSNPQRYADYMRRKERETELLRTVPPNLRPYYREKVNAYFNRLGAE